MQGVLEIQSMSVAEKLSAISLLWESLEKVEVPSPNWHKEVLENRKKSVENGMSEFKDWETAKAELENIFR